MSLRQTAYLEKSRVPDRAKLQEAVQALGFDLTIDESYRPFASSGFLPCLLNGRKSGFEIYFESLDELLQRYPRLKSEIGSRGGAISFRWGSDMAECACVLIVSAALARSFGAIVHSEEQDLLYSVDQMVEQAKDAMQSTGPDPPAPAPKRPWWKRW